MKLKNISKTLLLPLIGRAFYSQQNNPLIKDDEAIRLFNLFKNECTSLLPYCQNFYSKLWIARAYQFETEIKQFIKNNPKATIISLGSGLDTTFYRVDNQAIKWIDIDLPEVIDLRKQLLTQNDRIVNIAISILKCEVWTKQVKKNKSEKYLFIAGGLFFYFSKLEVKKVLTTIIHEFSNSIITFDTISKKQLIITNNRLKKMNINTQVKWAIDSTFEIKSLLGLNLSITKKPHFNLIKYKNNFSLFTRCKMFYHDLTNKSGYIKINLN